MIATTDFNKSLKQNTDALNRHQATIDKCQDLWKILKSLKERETLTTHLGKSLTRPVVTRWNSLCDGLQDLYSFKQKLMHYKTHIITKSTKILTNEDFEHIEQYLEIMRPLAFAIDTLQGEKIIIKVIYDQHL